MPSICIGGQMVVLSGQQMRALSELIDQANETKWTKGDVALETTGQVRQFTIKINNQEYPSNAGDLDNISDEIYHNRHKLAKVPYMELPENQLPRQDD